MGANSTEPKNWPLVSCLSGAPKPVVSTSAESSNRRIVVTMMSDGKNAIGNAAKQYCQSGSLGRIRKERRFVNAA